MSKRKQPAAPANGDEARPSPRVADLIEAAYSLPPEEYRQFMRGLGRRKGREGYYVGQLAALDQWRNKERTKIYREVGEIWQAAVVGTLGVALESIARQTAHIEDPHERDQATAAEYRRKADGLFRIAPHDKLIPLIKHLADRVAKMSKQPDPELDQRFREVRQMLQNGSASNLQDAYRALKESYPEFVGKHWPAGPKSFRDCYGRWKNQQRD